MTKQLPESFSMKSYAKKTISILVILITLAIVLILATPIILSTSWAKNLVIAQLEKKYNAKISIDSISLHWFGKQQIKQIAVTHDTNKAHADLIELDTPLLTLFRTKNNLKKLIFEGNLQLQNATLSIGDKISLTDLSIQANDEKKIAIYGKSHQGRQIGEIAISGEVTFPALWSFSFKRFPSKIIENFIPQYPIYNILGSSFDADVKLNFPRKTLDTFSYDKTIKSPNLFLTSTGIYKKGIVHLLSTLKAKFVLTKDLSNILFKDASFQPVSAQSIFLDIEPNKTSIPIFPFKVQDLNIPNLNLDLQKIEYRNFGTLSDILSIIKLRPRPNQNVPIWFQNAPMSIKDGICSIERTDMLIDYNYQIGNWGTIDLVHKTLNMTLGITTQALSHAFNLKNLPDQYTIPMKISGPINDPHLHASSALKIIGAILLIEKQPYIKVPGKLALPPIDPSPPMRRPLPW